MRNGSVEQIREDLYEILRRMGTLVAQLDPAKLTPAQIAELLDFYNAVERVGAVGRMVMASAGG
jgi:DNA-binding GntR family transcriptional regulator